MERQVALIGFGLGGATFHAPFIAAAPGLRLATIVTSNPERAERAGREYPGAEVVAGVDAVWERAGEHGLVVITTPNGTHAELAMQALELDLPLVVDKPLATSSEAAAAVVEEANRRRVPLTVYHNRRWDSDQLTLRRLLREGALGRVHRYESRFERWRPEVREDAWSETTTPAEGGGILLDLGSHLVDQALVLFGEALDVYGEVDSRRGAAADDDVFIAITHRDGIYSHLWASAVAGARGPRLRVLGSEAAFVVDQLDGQEDALLAGERPDRSPDWGAEPQEHWGRLLRGDRGERLRAENGAWTRFYEQLSEALDGKGPLPVDPADAVAGLRVLERAAA